MAMKYFEIEIIYKEIRVMSLPTNSNREILSLPEDKKKLLLHSCCAPCSGEVMEALIFSKIDFSIFFYNPNSMHSSNWGGGGNQFF